MLDKLPENNSGFLAYRTTTQSIPTGGSVLTDMVFSTEVYDLLGEYDHTTGIFTARDEGTYICCWGGLLASSTWAVGEVYQTNLSINDGDYWGGVPPITGQRWSCMESVSSHYPTSVGSCSVHLNAGDNLRIGVYQTQGAAVNTYAAGQYNFFAVHKVGS